MKILLINPNFGHRHLSYSRSYAAPIGTLSIATYLKRNGCDVSIVDRFRNNEAYEHLYEKYTPDIVGVSVMSNATLSEAVAVSRFFMQKGVPIVWGGTYASVIPEIIITEGRADYVMVGEGEETWLDLVKTLESGGDISTVKGLYFPKNGKPSYTGDREFMDLSKLGAIDWSFIDIEEYFQTCYCYDRMLYLYMSKGCASACSFCFNGGFHKSTVRLRPVEYVLDEIEFLIKEHSLKTVYFADENWGTKREVREEFMRGIEQRNLKFVWGCQMRIGVCNEEDFKEMYAHGCRFIMMGVETPPGRLAKLVNKCVPYDKLEPTLSACERAGIITNISFIIGLPGETRQELKETVDFALSLSPTFYSVHVFYPIEKSVLERQLIEQGMYVPPQTLKQKEKIIMAEAGCDGIHKIPRKDIKAVRSFFLLSMLFKKTPQYSDTDSSFLSEALRSMLTNIEGNGLPSFVNGLFNSGKYFLSTAATYFLHPFIRRNYGLKGLNNIYKSELSNLSSEKMSNFIYDKNV